MRYPKVKRTYHYNTNHIGLQSLGMQKKIQVNDHMDKELNCEYSKE